MGKRATANLLTFHLARLCRNHRALATVELAKLGLHPGQNIALQKIGEEPGITQAQLAERLEVQQPTAANMLRRLEKGGFVRREPSPEDARASTLHLTDKGQEVLPKIEGFWRELEARVTQGLSVEEQLLMKRIIKDINRNIS
jgi:DNA-binding MarR family transcriptional regulator